MNREEAIAKIQGLLDDPIVRGGVAFVDQPTLRSIQEALSGPVPDPITGLVPCGGSKAVMWCTPGEGFWVASGKIGQLNGFHTEEMAKEAWNRAMGCRE